MNLILHLLFGRFTKFVKIATLIVVVISLFGCQPLDSVPIPKTPLVEVQIWTPSLLTKTPVPACVVVSGVELSVSTLSKNSVRIKITGLIPNEAVETIFNSQIKEQEREKTVSASADQKGVFEYSMGLRSDKVDSEFRDWQIRVVHSRGTTCTEISLPEKQVP